MAEEVQEGPKWLKELEEKRERRLKARLGHEAGAGSPCFTCEVKCPGLDLHFWRKICKNCKCGKENHDVNDDDIYGWAQFQLLGSKPNKTKKIVLPGRKDAVELEWTPKGQSDIVDTYLKELPVSLLPIKGSAAAQERKQLLQKQIPLHDIDPTLCHALSENEIKQMNDYVAHVKQNSVGLGHIMKLNEILRNRQRVNPQYLSNRTPMQLSQSQNIVLQGVDRSNALKLDPNLYELQKNLNQLHVKKPPLHDAQQNLRYSNQQQMDLQSGVTGLIRDLSYPSYQRSEDFPVNDKPFYADLIHSPNKPHRPNQTESARNLNYGPKLQGDKINDVQMKTHPPVPKENLLENYSPKQPYSNQIDNQTARNVNSVKDLNAQLHAVFSNVEYTNDVCPNKLYPNRPVNSRIDNLVGTGMEIKDVHAQLFNRPLDKDLVYPDMNVNFKIGDLKANPELCGLANIPHYASGKFNTFNDQQTPLKIGNVKDLAYSTYDPRGKTQYNANELSVEEENMEPTHVSVGIINDIEYPVVKSAKQEQNDFIPEMPRKNVAFDLNDVEILPSCYKCKKMFSLTDFVVGIDHSDALWHTECFKCTGCNQNLADMMYFYHKESGEIYCGRDYAKIRGIPRCQACDELIFVKEYCLAENSTFHVKHFCCYECDEPLAGNNYVMESQPLCVPCFEQVKAEKCNACLKVIKPDERGANLNGVHFHANDECFCCRVCKKALLDGKLLFKNSNLYCSTPCFAADK